MHIQVRIKGTKEGNAGVETLERKPKIRANAKRENGKIRLGVARDGRWRNYVRRSKVTNF